MQHIQSVSEDTHLEWLLVRIGKKVGCRMWHQERLGDVSLETLSLVTDPHRHRVLGHIDVLWFPKNELVAAYKIALCVLHLYDLGILFAKCVSENWVATQALLLKSMHVSQ